MRYFPRNAAKSVQVFRCATTGDRKYPASATSTIEGAFVPLDRKAHALEGGFYVKPFELYVTDTADVQVSDKLLIDGATYYVKKIMPCLLGTHPYQRCTISTEA